MVDEEANRKRIEEINKEILKIKEARERISQDYLNDKISFDEYKKRLKNELGYYNIDKRLLELYDEKKRLDKENELENHSSKINEKEKTEANQIKARKNLPKKKNQSKNIAILVVIAGLMAVAIFGLNGFRESGITGYFAIDSNETTEPLNQSSTINQSSLNETFDSENATAVETLNQTEDIEGINITKNIEENGAIVEEVEETTEETEANETIEEINQTLNQTIDESINETSELVEDLEGIEETEETILPINETQEENNATNETELVIEELINETTNETDNETIAEINQSMNQTESQTGNETINITNEFLNQTIEEISNETANETIPEQENITENLTINQTINETINQTIKEIINETVNATINDTAGINESFNQSINQSEEEQYEINITSIRTDNKTYFIDAKKNVTQEYDLRELLNTTASLFIATGTNTTEVNIVGTILTIFSEDDVETDMIKVKSLLNDSATEHIITIRYDLADNITFENQTMPYENETTEIITNYINEEVRLGDYESVLISLDKHFNLNESSNFVATTTPAIDSFIANNNLIVTLFKPEKIENYKEEIKLYHEENNSLIASILNISLTRESPFIKRIGILSTNQSNISINPYEYLKTNYTANVSCLNNYFEIIKENETFVFINQRNLPLRDICFIEAVEEESVQAFEIRMSVGEESIEEAIIEETIVQEPKEEKILRENLINKGVVFSQRKEINLTELQTNGELSLYFENSFSPDLYEVYLVIGNESNESLYFIEGMTLRRGGITGAFLGNGFAGRIATALTNFFMRIINFFSGGITGFFASDINQSNITIAGENETITEAIEEITENETSEEGISRSIINETPELIEDVEGIEETILPMNETQEENNATNETELVIEEQINETTNKTNNETINETITEINQTEPQTGNETINITNITEIINFTNETLNQTIEEISNETANETIPEQENITENLTINQTINETIEEIEEDIEVNETLEEINQTLEVVEDVEEIEEIILPMNETQKEKTIEELTTEQIDLGDMSDEINSLFISNNNTLVVEIYNELIETLNNHNLTDSNKRYFIEARFIANGFSYNISKTIKDNFTDEFILEIENPYHHDFTNLSLIVNLSTDKREISCRNPFDILERNNSISTIQINEINLPRRDSIRIEITASSPTFDYEIDNLGTMAKILITRREGDKFFIDYILKDSNASFNLSSDINASCGASDIKIEWLNDKQDNRLTFDASDCNSTIQIEVSKKNITGIWIEHNGYMEYIDLSDRIILNPDEIFLRGNCIECLSKNVCDPLTICPQSNSGLYGWDFVVDMIFNISTIETNDKELEKAELCLFNTYASTNQEINAYVTSEENSSCQPLYENIRTDFDSGYATIKKQSQKDVMFRPEWLCTDVKEILEFGINNSNEEIVFRIIGQDMNNSNQPFMCFDAGMLSGDECENALGEGCLPYLSISYANE